MQQCRRRLRNRELSKAKAIMAYQNYITLRNQYYRDRLNLARKQFSKFVQNEFGININYEDKVVQIDDAELDSDIKYWRYKIASALGTATHKEFLLAQSDMVRGE